MGHRSDGARNLHVVDARGTRDKNAYLSQLFGSSENAVEKAIVYCNSRTEVTTVARRLRRELRNRVMFYHAKMPNAERLEVERLFREGRLRVVIATSAFGEGIDLPDVADVVLFHLNFDFGEFNQQAGRAGRDGAPASIHLLYGQKIDRLTNFHRPRRAAARVTARIYRGLKNLARDRVLRGGDTELAGILGIDRSASAPLPRRYASFRIRISSRSARMTTGVTCAYCRWPEGWRWSATSAMLKVKRPARHSLVFLSSPSPRRPQRSSASSIVPSIRLA